MKKLIILFTVALTLTACEIFKVEKSYELDKRIFIFPTATIIGNNTQRLAASVSQIEIGSDAVRRLQLDKLHFYVKNIKTGVERTIISDRTVVDVNDLTKNSEYLVSIEGFIDNNKSERSSEIFISTYPSPQAKAIITGSTYFETPFNPQRQVSGNLEMGISFLMSLNQPQIATYSLTTFKTQTTEKIIEFNLSSSKYYQCLGWTDDNKKIYFLIIENNTSSFAYYDIDKKAFVSLPFSTTRKIQRIQISSDSKKIAFKVGTDTFIYNFEDKTEIKLPVSMEGFQWIKNRNSLAYTHTVSDVGGNKKYYLLSQFDLEKMESKPIIKRAIIQNLGGFKISPDYKKVIFGSNLAGGFNAWHYDIENDKFTMIPNESGAVQFKWLNNDEFVINGYRGINSYRF